MLRTMDSYLATLGFEIERRWRKETQVLGPDGWRLVNQK